MMNWLPYLILRGTRSAITCTSTWAHLTAAGRHQASPSPYDASVGSPSLLPSVPFKFKIPKPVRVFQTKAGRPAPFSLLSPKDPKDFDLPLTRVSLSAWTERGQRSRPMATTEASSASGAGAAYEEERRKRILDNLKHLEVLSRGKHPARQPTSTDQSPSFSPLSSPPFSCEQKQMRER